MAKRGRGDKGADQRSSPDDPAASDSHSKRASEAGAPGSSSAGDAQGPRVLRVFISSPSDVDDERKAAERATRRVGDVWQAHVRLLPVRWEKKHYEAREGFQTAIGEMSAFDIVVGIVWKRIGSPLPPEMFKRADGTAYESGTVYEIETAIADSERTGRPAVYVFRKTAPVSYSENDHAAELAQHQALKAWWDRTFRDAEGHFVRGYQSFATTEAFEPELERLLETHLRETGVIPNGLAWDPAVQGSPYPGLIAYDREHASVFFGRSLASAMALEELTAAAARDWPALFIVGPSASGKSSLAQAGLAPLFSGSRIAGVEHWIRLAVEPSERPLSSFSRLLFDCELGERLRSSPHPTAEAFEQLALQSTEAAARLVAWALPPKARLLVILDQLESVLDSAQRAALARLTAALLDQSLAYVIATLRSDRYPDLQLDPDWFEVRRRGALFDLPPPGGAELVDIIRGPARAAGLVFEEADGVSLANRIAADMTDADALPLLQMTLSRLYDARKGNLLLISAYDAMGGLEGAIAAHAEEVFSSVSLEGQSALDDVLRALVADIDDGARLTLRTPEFARFAVDPNDRELVRRLVEGRLLVSADGEIRVAHEALLRRWTRAAGSVALRPEVLRLGRQIEPNFRTWEKTGLDQDLLPRGTTLAAAETLLAEDPRALPQELADYVRRSVARGEEETRNIRRRSHYAQAAAGLFAVVAVLAGVSYVASQDNYADALLARSERYLIEERPLSAAITSERALDALWSARLLAALGLGSSRQLIRARSIAELATPAAFTPCKVIGLAHPRSVTTAVASAVAFSDRGDRLAVANEEGPIAIASLADTKDVADGHSHDRRYVSAIAYVPGTRSFISGAYDHRLQLTDADTGRETPFAELDTGIEDLAVDHAGRHVAAALRDGALVMSGLGRGVAAPMKIPGTDGHLWAVAFSRDDRYFAYAADNGEISVRQTSDGALAGRFSANGLSIWGLAFGSDDQHIVTASETGQLRLWTLKSGGATEASGPITEFAGKLLKVRASHDGRLIAAAGLDGIVRLWAPDGAALGLRGTIDGHDGGVLDAAFSPDSSLLATVSNTGVARVWDVSHPRPIFDVLRDNDKETLKGRYSGDGRYFLTGGRDGNANLYRVGADARLQAACAPWRQSQPVWAIAMSDDGRLAVTAATGDGRADNVIRIWNTATCTARDIPVGPFQIRALALDSRSTRLVWSDAVGQIFVLDLASSQRRTIQPRSGQVAFDVDIAADGSKVASVNDKTIVVWDLKTGSRSTFAGDGSPVFAVRFRPDGGLLAAATEGKHVLVWDLSKPSGAPKRIDLDGPGGPLFFSRDGRQLVGANGQGLSIWTANGWREQFELESSTVVGTRGVFGLNPATGDIAFDGNDGLVRIFPGALAVAADARIVKVGSAAQVQGTNVSFDPPSRGPSIDDVVMSNSGVCPRVH